MIELLGGTAAILGVLLVAAIVYALSYRGERDEARLDLTIARSDVSALTKRVNEQTNRITVLRRDNITQQRTIDALREGHDRLVDERESFRRELGRLKAEKVAAKPKRGPNGRFVPKKPKPEAPKSTFKIKPVSCG